MSNTTLSAALAHVADVLGSSDYSDKEVFIMIPNIRLADEEATEKYLQDFRKICTFSLANNPGTQKFCAFQPRGVNGVDEVWALEHFDSESALAEHRASTLVVDMLSWLQNAKPNGPHPLPVPVPLQILEGSFVRPAIQEAQDPFVVITHIESQPEMLSHIEAAMVHFSAKAQHIEDVLLFMPGKTEKGAWVVTAYTSEQGFEEKGFVKETFEEGMQIRIVESWEEHFLELKAGYLFRSWSGSFSI